MRDFVPFEQEAVQFWRSELNANQWVMNVLENGFVMPFVNAPEEFEADNNISANRQMDFVQRNVAELRPAGIIKFAEEKLFCVSPLCV